MGITFSESAAAIEHCRDLCAEYGFTVKQEASTHRVNIQIVYIHTTSLLILHVSRTFTSIVLVKDFLIHYVTPNQTHNEKDLQNGVIVDGELSSLKTKGVGNLENHLTQRRANTTMN